MINDAIRSLGHRYFRFCRERPFKKRLKQIRKWIPRYQKMSKGPRSTLAVIDGGLGDFFMIIPMLHALIESGRKVVLLSPTMSGYPTEYQKANPVFDLIVKQNSKTPKALAEKLGEYSFCEVFNLGPTSSLENEEVVRSLKQAKKYGYSSRYCRIGNYPIEWEAFRKIRESYDLFVQGSFDQTNNQVQQSLLERVNIPSVGSDRRFVFPHFSVNCIPDTDYFVVFLNNANDPRNTPLGILLGLSKYIVGKYPLKLVLLGGEDDVRTTLFENELPPKTLINLRGQTSLGDYCELIRRARLVISSDTSASHLANAYETKSIVFCTDMFDDALFPYEWGFGIKNQLVIQNKMKCGNCFCRYDGRVFLKECAQRYVCADGYDLNDTIKQIETFFPAGF